MALMWRRSRNDIERENRRLQAEIAVLQRDNEDLRDAAMSWRRLYEQALVHAPYRRVSQPAVTAARKSS